MGRGRYVQNSKTSIHHRISTMDDLSGSVLHRGPHQLVLSCLIFSLSHFGGEGLYLKTLIPLLLVFQLLKPVNCNT